MENTRKNYVKFIYLLFLISVILMLGICLFSNFSISLVSAKDEAIIPELKTNTSDSNLIGEGGELISLEKSGMDENLYRALIEIYNKEKGYEPNTINYVTSLSTHLFTDLEITTLNLSNQNIKSLTAFSWLYFNSSLTELKLDYNNIEVIETLSGENPLFRVAPNLEILSITNNKLSSLTLPTGMLKLRELRINNNQLNSINLSMLKPTEEGELNIYLGCNYISEWSDIQFPNDNELVNKMNVNLLSNYLTMPEFTSNNINLILGFQNSKFAENKFTTSNSAYYYKTGIENLLIVFGFKNSDMLPIVLKDSDVENGINLADLLGVGYFTAYYSIDNVTKENVYDKDNVNYSMLKPFEFSILPAKPTCKIEVDGEMKDFDNSKQVGAKDIIKFFTIDNNASICYRISNEEEWINGDILKLTRGGQYSVSFKSVVKAKDGSLIESEVETILIRTSQSLYMPDVVLFLLVALFAVLVFAVAMPLIKKFVMKN